MDLNLYKFKKGDTFKKDTSDTLYEVVRDETVTGIVWATVAGSTAGQFRFSNKHDALTLMSPANDEYEYAVLMSTAMSGDLTPDEEEWTTRVQAEKTLKEELADQENRVRFQTENYKPYRDWKFRIVKRRKAGPVEEL